MTPETIIQAVYEISQAAETERDALLGGAEFGVMLAAQFKAQGRARRRLGSASRTIVESILEQLATSQVPYQDRVASGALKQWRYELR